METREKTLNPDFFLITSGLKIALTTFFSSSSSFFLLLRYASTFVCTFFFYCGIYIHCYFIRLRDITDMTSLGDLTTKQEPKIYLLFSFLNWYHQCIYVSLICTSPQPNLWTGSFVGYRAQLHVKIWKFRNLKCLSTTYCTVNGINRIVELENVTWTSTWLKIQIYEPKKSVNLACCQQIVIVVVMSSWKN